MLSQGLSFVYSVFEMNHDYMEQSYTGEMEQLGLFKLTTRFLKLPLPWDVLSGQIKKKFDKEASKSTACCYITLQKTCL